MIRSIKVALAGLMLVMGLAVAPAVSAHGDAGFLLPDPSCNRTAQGGLVFVVDNPVFLASPAGWSFAAVYVQSGYYGDPGWAITNGNYWFATAANNTYPSWLYNYGTGQWQDTFQMVDNSHLIGDYYRAWFYVYWADGHTSWAAVSNWCFA